MKLLGLKPSLKNTRKLCKSFAGSTGLLSCAELVSSAINSGNFYFGLLRRRYLPGAQYLVEYYREYRRQRQGGGSQRPQPVGDSGV